MDYETRATSRSELRLFARLFRSICGFSEDEPVDPIVLLTSNKHHHLNFISISIVFQQPLLKRRNCS